MTEHNPSPCGCPACRYLAERIDFLEVRTIEVPEISGWDVALVLDGTYYGEDLVTKRDMVEAVRCQLADVLPADALTWMVRGA